MKILVVGGGGREHAIVWSLARSPRVSRLYCAPGNGGIAGLAECVDIAATDLDGMTSFALREAIDLVFVAPDDPLALGMVDRMESAGLRVFGPHANAAAIESSKVFSKGLMRKYGIPTAAYGVFTDLGQALEYVGTQPLPVVVKADGLALGKGVVIARTHEEAREAVCGMMRDGAFGDAGRTVVIEEYMTGPELTVLAFTDGTTVVPMPNARDHKRANDNDEGLNTGGMGAVVPGHVPAEGEEAAWMDRIFQPTVDALRAEGRPFKGVLYFQLMLTPNGAKVIEYNARFGDPEAQAVLPLLRTDFLDIVDAVIDRRLDRIDVEWEPKASCCVVMASGGYPASYRKGYEVFGLGEVHALVFHAGTRKEGNRILTNGGRVLGVTAVADSLREAVDAAYADVARIRFQDMHVRSDIGRTTLAARTGT
ncbi:MAG: phosphoribosylamine--glycine ligase [Clostridia bacterium]|nr:phosphoribosylamine--glycine ligase [Clostridia bacterium]